MSVNATTSIKAKNVWCLVQRKNVLHENMARNILITVEDVESILNAIQPIGDNKTNLKIRNLQHYQTAFVHKSVLNDSTSYSKSNEVLEFLGDSFIGATVAKYLYDRFEGQQEGFLTKTRTMLVRSNMLYRFARFLMMGKFILLSAQVDRLTAMGSNKGRNNPRLYEDVFEAFVGAIIEDFQEPDDPVAGVKYAYRFIISVIEHTVDFADLVLNHENFKDTLQRYFQALKWSNPVYIDLLESGPAHTRQFTKGVFLQTIYLTQLPDDVQERALRYHAEQLRTQIPKIADGIRQHAEETSSVIIGLAEANKKAVAEQSASAIALCCLGIDHNWENKK